MSCAYLPNNQRKDGKGESDQAKDGCVHRIRPHDLLLQYHGGWMYMLMMMMIKFGRLVGDDIYRATSILLTYVHMYIHTLTSLVQYKRMAAKNCKTEAPKVKTTQALVPCIRE